MTLALMYILIMNGLVTGFWVTMLMERSHHASCDQTINPKDFITSTGMQFKIGLICRICLKNRCLLILTLPTAEEDAVMLTNFSMLVTHEIVQHMPFFAKNFSDVIISHILHTYSKEMARKSEIVSY